MTNLRRIQILFFVVVVTTPIFVIAGYLLSPPQDFIAGIGVEFLGAWLTAGGVLGLELLLSVPDEDVTDLKKEVAAQSAKIADMQQKLDVLLTRLEHRTEHDN